MQNKCKKCGTPTPSTILGVCNECRLQEHKQPITNHNTSNTFVEQRLQEHKQQNYKIEEDFLNCNTKQTPIINAPAQSIQPVSHTVKFCKKCDRYLVPPKSWKKFSSSELLFFLIGRTSFRSCAVEDAHFIKTDPNSRKIKIRGTVKNKIVNLCINVKNTQCEDCAKMEAQQYWQSVVQLRQKSNQKRTLLFLEQSIRKNNALVNCTAAEDEKDGIDAFFTSLNAATKFVDFVQSTVVSRVVPAQKLVSQDFKSNLVFYKNSFSVEIVPLCRDDLVILEDSYASRLATNKVLIVTRVTTVLVLMDVVTNKTVEICAKNYWRNKDKIKLVMSSDQLKEYLVVEKTEIANDCNEKWMEREKDELIRKEVADRIEENWINDISRATDIDVELNENSINSGFNENSISGQCNKNSINRESNKNNINRGFNENSIGGECYKNSINRESNKNNINRGFNKNSIGGECYKNSINRECYKNSTNGECNKNSINRGSNMDEKNVVRLSKRDKKMKKCKTITKGSTKTNSGHCDLFILANETPIHCKSHLGYIVNVGDIVLCYDTSAVLEADFNFYVIRKKTVKRKVTLKTRRPKNKEYDLFVEDVIEDKELRDSIDVFDEKGRLVVDLNKLFI